MCDPVDEATSHGHHKGRHNDQSVQNPERYPLKVRIFDVPAHVLQGQQPQYLREQNEKFERGKNGFFLHRWWSLLNFYGFHAGASKQVGHHDGGTVSEIQCLPIRYP